jgi:hypothetical protein
MFTRLTERNATVVSHSNIKAAEEKIVYGVVKEHLGQELTNVDIMRLKTMVSEKNNKEFDLLYEEKNLGKIIYDINATDLEVTIHFIPKPVEV